MGATTPQTPSFEGPLQGLKRVFARWTFPLLDPIAHRDVTEGG